MKTVYSVNWIWIDSLDNSNEYPFQRDCWRSVSQKSSTKIQVKTIVLIHSNPLTFFNSNNLWHYCDTSRYPKQNTATLIWLTKYNCRMWWAVHVPVPVPVPSLNLTQPWNKIKWIECDQRTSISIDRCNAKQSRNRPFHFISFSSRNLLSKTPRLGHCARQRSIECTAPAIFLIHSPLKHNILPFKVIVVLLFHFSFTFNRCR